MLYKCNITIQFSVAYNCHHLSFTHIPVGWLWCFWSRCELNLTLILFFSQSKTQDVGAVTHGMFSSYDRGERLKRQWQTMPAIQIIYLDVECVISFTYNWSKQFALPNSTPISGKVYPFQRAEDRSIWWKVTQFTKINIHTLLCFFCLYLQRLHNQAYYLFSFTFCYSMLVYPTRSYLIIRKFGQNFISLKVHCTHFVLYNLIFLNSDFEVE